VHRRTINALHMRGITLPVGANPRKLPAYKEEYRRQTLLFRKEREAQKTERRLQRQEAARAEARQQAQ